MLLPEAAHASTTTHTTQARTLKLITFQALTLKLTQTLLPNPASSVPFEGEGFGLFHEPLSLHALEKAGSPDRQQEHPAQHRHSASSLKGSS
jgi:hypothetical protein